MSYSIHSDIKADLFGKSPRLVRVATAWLLLPLSYFGAFVSPAIFLALPFQILQKHHLSKAVFWPLVILFGVFACLMISLSLISWLRWFRRRVIYVEAGVCFVGWLFAVAVVIWIYPPKW
jgi:di/tricarboxylate transporter